MAQVIGRAAEVSALAQKLKEINVADVEQSTEMDVGGDVDMMPQEDAATRTSGGIKVKTLTGKEIEIDIDFTDKVETIKERLEQMEGIPPEQQRLIFAGKQLADDKTARACNLEPGCVIHLVLALRGGGFSV